MYKKSYPKFQLTLTRCVMVDLAEIQAAYYMVAATGVLVAALFYILNLRLLQKKMKIDATILYGNLIGEKQKIRDWRHLLFETDYTSLEEFDKLSKSNPEEYAIWMNIGNSMNQLGLLVHEKIVDPGMLFTILGPIWPKIMWAKFAPIIRDQRKLWNDPLWGYYGECLYNEAERMYPDVKVPQGRYKSKNAEKT